MEDGFKTATRVLQDRTTRPTPTKVFPCLFCSRTFYSSQALGGHQNAHKKERNFARKAKRSASDNEFGTFLSPQPLVLAPTPTQHHHQLGRLFGPSMCIAAHAATLGRVPEIGHCLDSWLGFGTMPRFEGAGFYGKSSCSGTSKRLHQIPYHEEDEESNLNWQRSIGYKACTEDSNYNQIQPFGPDFDRDNKDPKIDLSLHL